MAPPAIAFLALLIGKKVVAVALYQAGKRYGWPRVYRRVLEYNRNLTPVASRRVVAAAVKRVFYAPAAAGEVLRNADVREFASKLTTAVETRGGAMAAALGKAIRAALASVATTPAPPTSPPSPPSNHGQLR